MVLIHKPEMLGHPSSHAPAVPPQAEMLGHCGMISRIILW